MYERIFDISKMIAKIDIMIFCNIAPHSAEACVKHEMAKRPNGTPVSLNSTSVSLNGVLIQCKVAKAIVGC